MGQGRRLHFTLLFTIYYLLSRTVSFLKRRFGIPKYFFAAILFSGLTIFIAFAKAKTQFVYEPSGRRDPMMPLVTTSGLIRDIQSLDSRDDLYLEGIIYDKEGKSFAIIDGQIVKVGDTIGEIKILDIQEDKVIILKDNQTQEMGLEEEGE